LAQGGEPNAAAAVDQPKKVIGSAQAITLSGCHLGATCGGEFGAARVTRAVVHVAAQVGVPYTWWWVWVVAATWGK
jgi:hypothetical protein